MGVIYLMTNKKTGEQYVGSTLHNIEKRHRERMNNYKQWLKDMTPGHILFENIRKHGIENFEYKVLENVDTNSKHEIKIREGYWIQQYKTVGAGLNNTEMPYIPKPIEHYSNPRHGYWGKRKMLDKYKTMLNKVYALQRHKQLRAKDKKKLYTQESASFPFHSVQIDLAFLPNLATPINNNYQGFMVVIDVFSRYLWVEPFRDRKNLHLKLEPVLQRMKRKFHKTPSNMTGDNEFATTQLQALAARYNFKWWFGDAGEKYRTGISEKSIRTMKDLIKRYLTQNETTKYINVLQTLCDNYNDTKHDTTNTRPDVAIHTAQTFPKPPNKVDMLHVGDTVRVELPRKRGFTKGDVPRYSQHIHQIVGRDKNRYKVENIESNKPPTQLGLKSNKLYNRAQLYKIDGVIKGGSSVNTKNNNNSNNYDNQIQHNKRVNHHKRYLKRNDLNLDNIIDKKDRQDAKKHVSYDIPISNNKLPKQTRELRGKIQSLESNKKPTKLQQLKNQIDMYKRSPVTKSRDKILQRKENELRELKKRIAIPKPRPPSKSKPIPIPLRRSTRVRKQTEFYKPYKNILLKAEKRKLKNKK